MGRKGGFIWKMARFVEILWRACILLLFPGVFLSACERASYDVMAPEEIVARAADRMRELRGFHFLIERSGAPAFLDPEQAIAFRRAEGDVEAPDKAQATVRIIGPGLVAEVEIISIGEIQWETNLLTGAWQELPPNWGFNPALLFDQTIGIQAVLDSDLQAITLVGFDELDEVPGLALYRLEGEVRGDKLYALSFGMMGPDSMTVKLWIKPETFELYRMQITDPKPDADEPSVWQMDFWDFDQPIEIYPPAP
jgi:hypothetical protein